MSPKRVDFREKCNCINRLAALIAALDERGRRGQRPRLQPPMTPIEAAAFGRNRHREERSDVAIQESQGALSSLDCFAIARLEGRASFDALGLAMTPLVRPKCNLL